jgi:signal transduction histidine kinase
MRHKLLVDSRRTAIAAAENETKQVVFSALAAQTAAENGAKILDLNNKAHLATKEQEIMGNVAHDMKTPLHSIFAELESVRDAVDEACKEAAVPGADASVVLGRLKSATDGTLDVVDSMTQFLVMSINHSQDYAKLTSNIALKPTLETVSMPEVLLFVTKCMAHQTVTASSTCTRW